MLDALLSEARLRWGLDPADGVAVIPMERLVGLPLEPTRPVVIVPLAALSVPRPAVPPMALPGRHLPAGPCRRSLWRAGRHDDRATVGG
jgi:hypothetical protein